MLAQRSTPGAGQVGGQHLAVLWSSRNVTVGGGLRDSFWDERLGWVLGSATSMGQTFLAMTLFAPSW